MHHEFKVIKSEPQLWVVKYKNRESIYNWMLLALKRYDYFEITSYVGPHMCISVMISEDHSRLVSNFIVNEIRDHIKEILIIFIIEIGAIVKNRFNYTPDYRKLWDVKQKGMVLVYGD